MEKKLLTIEFRYCDAPKGEYDSGHKDKTITIGVFDTYDEAALEGNKIMEIFESHFKLNPNWNRKERFSKNGGCFGYPKSLITDLGYLQMPFSFYAKIQTLKFGDIEQTISEVLESVERYKVYKKSENNE